MFRGQDLNDTTIEGFGLGSKFDCVFHPESLAPLGWGGRNKQLVESTKSRGNSPSLLSLQTFMTTFKDCPQENVFVII